MSGGDGPRPASVSTPGFEGHAHPPRASKRKSTLHMMTLEPVISKLEKFILYETQSYMYVVGCDKLQSEYRMLKLDRKIVHPGSL
eukprot:CAMPEP_0119495400 /NCGR_PEP_ID=MMETSP1344-20130328/19048_1 /TAXON_ID=236787 /ORGANISM="Florenciella parvula, Strain CCMP2471" /LENGTH=84 /DNA_ID=CAMNT_0007530981 /DNA_START=52 /DNA_END=302 /DNA_ORIENTATION=-